MRKWIKPAALFVYLLCSLLIFACIGPHVAEQTDHYDGVTYHRFYRYTGYLLGHATSHHGVRFDKDNDNPIMENSLFPYQVEHEGNRYLILRHGNAYYLYDVNVPTSPGVLNDGKPILQGEYFNVGVAVKGSRWHMLVEGKADETFHLRYTWADFPDLDFNINLGPVVINDAGNPYLAYIPERDAILALYGADYRATGLWRVRAATFDFTSWTVRDFFLAKAGVHIADPDLGVGVEPYPLIFTVGSNQDSISTYYFRGSKLDFYDAIVAGHVELEEAPGNPTMTADFIQMKTNADRK